MSNLVEVLNINNPQEVIPAVEDAIKIITAKHLYEKNNKDSAWTKKNFAKCPWGIAYLVSPRGRGADANKVLRYLALAVVLEWQDLATQLIRTALNFGMSKPELNYVNTEIWVKNSQEISTNVKKAFESVEVQKVLNEDLNEAIEKHNELNPKLFNEDNKLKSEIIEKINQMVDIFVEDLAENEVKIDIDDIILVGSNASFNYTDDSDIDVHIRVDVSKFNCPDNLYPAIYSAFRSLFNKRFDIEFYGIPVELYVETEETPLKSNGIYSVLNNEWIKFPEEQKIPQLDEEAFNKEFNIWEDRYTKLIADIESEKIQTEAEVVKYIEDIYELRKANIASDGEYSIGNLVFKEIRNKGYLDNLKDLKNELISKQLSLKESQAQEIGVAYRNLSKKYRVDLEELVYGKNGFMQTCYPQGFPDFAGDVLFSEKYWNEFEQWLQDTHGIVLTEDTILEAFINPDDLYKYRNKLSQLTKQQVIVQPSGLFTINLVKESEVSHLINILKRESYLSNVHSIAGKYDFSTINSTNMPKRYYTIQGNIIQK